jgi:alkylation response protein AidB-like acyl-CoA dehydrogenase
MNWERAAMSGMHAGTIRRLCNLSRQYISQRENGGKKLSSHQMVQFRLAEMFLAAETTQLLALKAAALIDSGKDATAACARAKIFSSEALQSAAKEALQLHGANGFTESYGIARILSDSQAASIYSGANDVLRELMASRL